MSQNQQTNSTPQHPRYSIIDAVRGAAIIGVVFYHLGWDLRFLDFITVNIDVDPLWIMAQRILLASFLLLTGVSLALAHAHGMRWQAFWRRIGILVAASLLVTVGTIILFPGAFVYFGVLHAIALFSVMALPFRTVPLWLVFGVAAVFIGLPYFVHLPEFNIWWLSWIGFWTIPPLTQDLVPIFPGFGFTLVGLGGMRLALQLGAGSWLGAFQPSNFLWRGLVTAGRWSLLIYLVHQLALLAILYPLAAWLEPGAPKEQTRDVAFYGSCFSSCLDANGSATQCKAYCQCSLEQVEDGDHWALINAPETSLEQQSLVNSITGLCTAMSE